MPYTLIIMMKLKTVMNNPPINVTAHKGMLSKKPQSATAVFISSGSTAKAGGAVNIPNEQMGYISNSEAFYGVKMDAIANLSGQQEIKDLFNVMERSGKWRL